MNAKEANRRARKGQVAATRHEPALQGKYEAVLRANARRVSGAYRKAGIVAAANVPSLDEILEGAVLSASATARTKAERQRIAEAAAQPILSDAGKRELRALLEGIVAAQAGVQAERIVAGVRDRVAAIMLEALTEGYSVPDTAALLQATLELDAVWQATMLARTDLISLSNAASHKAAAELEEGPKFKIWLSAGDDRVRPTHVEANGQVQPIDMPYRLSDDAELQYPGDPAGPDGEVINCRCVSVFTDTATATLAHSDLGGIHDQPVTQFDATTASAWDEAKHQRHPRGKREGGRFASKHGPWVDRNGQPTEGLSYPLDPSSPNPPFRDITLLHTDTPLGRVGFSTRGDAGPDNSYYESVFAVTDDAGETVGKLDLVHHEGRVSIEMVEVPEQYRRNGIATTMLDAVKHTYGDKVDVAGDFATDAGQAWLMANAVAAAAFDESKHRRYAKGTRVSGREGGGRFAPKDGVSTAQAQVEARAAVDEAQKTEPISGQLTMGPLTAERAMGRDIRLTGAMADGKVYRVESISEFGTKGNTLVTMRDKDGNIRKVVGLVEVEDVSQGFQAPDAPVAPAPAGEPVPTSVPVTPETPVAAPVPEPPAPAPTPDPTPEPKPAPPPKPEVVKPVPKQVSVTAGDLKPGETFTTDRGDKLTVVGPYQNRRSYWLVEDENGTQKIMRRKQFVLVNDDHPAWTRRQKSMVSNVDGVYGEFFDKTPAKTNVVTEYATAASLEAGKVIQPHADADVFPNGFPKMELKETKSNSVTGQFWHQGTRPDKLTLRRASPTDDSPVSTMHHETGHYLDVGVLRPLSTFGRPTDDMAHRMIYASQIRDPNVLGPVMDAIDNSEAMKRVNLIASGQGGYTLVSNAGTQYERSRKPDAKHARYLQEPSERWARAYEQYVATKVGARLDDYRRDAAMPLNRTHWEPSVDIFGDESMKAYYGWYWTEDDFKPIEAEIDSMFGRLGWRKDG